MYHVYQDIDMPLIGVLACMERTGAALDFDHLNQLSEDAGSEIDRLRNAIFSAAGREFNVDSPKQLSEILFDEIGLKPIKKNQRGYSTDARYSKSFPQNTSYQVWFWSIENTRKSNLRILMRYLEWLQLMGVFIHL